MRPSETDTMRSQEARVCVICGSRIRNRRQHARYCSASCRVEASRLKGIIDGTYSGPYRSVAERLSKLSKSAALVVGQAECAIAVESAQEAAQSKRLAGPASLSRQ